VVPSYAWTRNGIAAGGNGPAFSASDFKNGDVVAVTVRAGTGPCDNDPNQVTASVTVHLNTAALNPAIKITSANSFLCNCAPASFQATVTNGGSTPSYQWMVNGIATGYTGSTWLSNGLLPTDVVTCQYTDLAGCVAGSPITSNAISLAAGTSGASAVTIVGPLSPECPGSPLTFTATPVNAGSVPTYQWKVNGSNAGSDSSGFTTQTLVSGDVVTCTITPDPAFACATGGNANSNAITVALGVSSLLSVQVTLPGGVICKGETATLGTVSNNVNGVESWQWEVNGAPVGGNSPSLSQVFNEGDVVQCTIMVAGSSGACVLNNTASSPPVTVQVVDQASPSVNVAVTGNNACAGNPIAFSATLEDAGSGPSIEWLVNGISQGDQTAAFNSSQLKNNDLVTCSVTPGAGACWQTPVLSNAIIAVILPLPQVTIYPADITIPYGSQVTMNAVVSNDVVSYQWDPAGLLINAQTLQPLTVSLTSGVTFSLTVQNAEQCTATAGAVIEIGHGLAMPNAFSPNGDGINDVFRIPPGTTLQLDEFVIFNRWGNKIFSTHDITRGWDGTVSGQPAPAGAYIYVITGTDAKGIVRNEGTVMLMR
jgi:gliding motility-associated-like protein